MVAFSHSVKTVPDVDFTLNTGHMKSCVRYGVYLADRHQELITELRYRGFSPNFPPISYSAFSARCHYYPSQAWLTLASNIVRPRIASRLTTMKRAPAWTRRFMVLPPQGPIVWTSPSTC